MSHVGRSTAAPQDAKVRRIPWSERFDCIFRNEGAAGSNPASSTERPGQGNVGVPRKLLAAASPASAAPRVFHKTARHEHIAR